MGGVGLLNGLLSKEMLLDCVVRGMEVEEFGLRLRIIVVGIGVIGSMFSFVYGV